MQKIFKINSYNMEVPTDKQLKKVEAEIKEYYFIKFHGYSRIDNFPMFSIFLYDNYVRSVKLLKITKQFEKLNKIENDVKEFEEKYKNHMVDIR